MMKPRRVKDPLVVFTAVAAAAISVVLLLLTRTGTFAPSAPETGSAARYVSRVIDGDTLTLDDRRRVRLVGIDTPEIHESEKLERDVRRSGTDAKTIQTAGIAAKNFTERLCLGKAVRLSYDVVTKDRYGRTLAYVYLEDGTFVNAEIVRQGYGQVMTIPPNVAHAPLFLKLQKEARRGRRGLWARGDIP